MGDGSTNVEVPNGQGILLPSTGGIGTALFYIIGSLFVIVGITLLATKRYMMEHYKK